MDEGKIVQEPQEDLIEKFGFPLLTKVHDLWKKADAGTITKYGEKQLKDLLDEHGDELLVTAIDFYKEKKD